MMRKLNNRRGQTALILILLTAAALIFLAISMNWGRIAQTKALLTVAADQSAALLASNVASYGEMEKQGNLKDINQQYSSTGIFLDIILIVIAVVVCIISWGTAAPLMSVFLTEVILVASVVMAVATLALQLAVVQPGISSMWNKLQKNQPIQQQFFEQGVSTALSGVVTDQVSIRDYLDWNANGVADKGTSIVPNDTVGRFALFYSDRLKMLNKPDIPQVVYFYNQLDELMNGKTCVQNEQDASAAASFGLGVGVEQGCLDIAANYCNSPAGIAYCSSQNPPITNCQEVYCIKTPAGQADPACQAKIPGFYQINDACAANSNPANAKYNPYCDPCCQEDVQDPLYNPKNPLHMNQYISKKPEYCKNAPFDASPQCYKNNPFNSPGNMDSQYPSLYDPTYQNYNNQKNPSLLDLLGRDMQLGPFTDLKAQGDFPNGIFPFFWLTKHYNLEVDKMNNDIGNLQSSELHWCDKKVAGVYTPPTGYPSLTQLSLTSCTGAGCCVGDLADSVVNGVPTASTNVKIDTVGTTSPNPSPAQDPSFGEDGSTGKWLEGDNQFCSTSWPYNGASGIAPDGTCEWTGTTTAPASGSSPISSASTIDSLDETVHTLSDFVKFSNVLLNTGADTLSSTFSTWYPQASDWIDPNSGKLTKVASTLNAWGSSTGSIAKWLTNTYASDTAWCVPTEPTLLSNSNGGTDEDVYIKNYGGSGQWGDLLHVKACLDYNSSTPTANYNTCLNALTSHDPAGCTVLPSPSCTPPVLGRSLIPLSSPFHQFTGSYGPPPATTALPSGTSCASYSGYTSGCTTQGPYITSAPPNSPPAGTVQGVGTTVYNENTNKCNYSVPYNCNCGYHAPYYPNSPQCSCNNAGGASCKSSPCTVTCTCSGTYGCSTCYNNGTCEDPISSSITTSFRSQSCDPNQPGSYASWIQANHTVFKNESPKFALRSQFINDIYTRAQSMQTAVAKGGQELQDFLNPTGPAQQLVNANTSPPTATLPNTVIYGWIDNSSHGQPGKAHIVKVTAYSAGRVGSYGNVFQSAVPWIKTATRWVFSWFSLVDQQRSFTLLQRDGPVYVSVKRWDEDHSSATLFPNGHVLWQFMYHNPNPRLNTGNNSSPIGNGSIGECTDGITGYGFGLEPNTTTGARIAGLIPTDKVLLGRAFMINEKPDGQANIDPNSGGVNATRYSDCINEVNALLVNAPESHACAVYVASNNPSKYIKDKSALMCTDANCAPNDELKEKDYSLKFVDMSYCGGSNVTNAPLPDDF